MTEPVGTFNREAFAQRMNVERQLRDLTWSEMAEQSGVSLPTLSRLSHGKALSVQTVAALIAWAGIDARTFMAAGVSSVCALCGEPGPGGGSHQSPIDCVMALKARISELERTYITFTDEKDLQRESRHV